MKNRIIIAAIFTACLALCAAVWPQAEKVEKPPAPSETTAVTTLQPTLPEPDELILQEREKNFPCWKRWKLRMWLPKEKPSRRSMIW